MPWGSYDESLVASIRIPHGIHARADALMSLRFADAEQAKSSGGMVALYPTNGAALQMMVPGGEPPQDMHVTLCYLGEDVSDLGDPGGLTRALGQIADSYTAIDARVMGHATFNPDNGPEGDMDPCAVYLISDSNQLAPLHQDVLAACSQEFATPTQHAPWIPHLTAGYGIDANQLSYTGPITFDRIGLKWAGNSHYYPLLGS